MLTFISVLKNEMISIGFENYRLNNAAICNTKTTVLFIRSCIYH